MAMVEQASAALIEVLETADKALRARFDQPAKKEELALLIPKHLGQGMEYLRLFSATTARKACAF